MAFEMGYQRMIIVFLWLDVDGIDLDTSNTTAWNEIIEFSEETFSDRVI